MNEYYGKEDEQRKKVFDGQNTSYANELKIKRESISIVYDEEKLRVKLGDLWNYHLEAVNKEPPEMKILFALVNECKICENYKQQAQEPCRFENPALSDFEEIETVSLYFQRWEIAKEKQVYYIDNVRVGR